MRMVVSVSARERAKQDVAAQATFPDSQLPSPATHSSVYDTRHLVSLDALIPDQHERTPSMGDVIATEQWNPLVSQCHADTTEHQTMESRYS